MLQGFFIWVDPCFDPLRVGHSKAGLPCFCGATLYTPFDMFCGGRSLTNFLVDDLLDIPDEVEKVLDLAQEFTLGFFASSLKTSRTPYGLAVGAAHRGRLIKRCSSDSPGNI